MARTAALKWARKEISWGLANKSAKRLLDSGRRHPDLGRRVRIVRPGGRHGSAGEILDAYELEPLWVDLSELFGPRGRLMITTCWT